MIFLHHIFHIRLVFTAFT